MRKMVLFDIDGTLVQDGGAAGEAFDQAFRELFGVSQASAAVDKHGRTDMDICRDAARHDADAIYAVGDAPGDILAGRQNRARTVAVGTGLTGLEALRPLQPDFLLPDLSDIGRFKRLLNIAD